MDNSWMYSKTSDLSSALTKIRIVCLESKCLAIQIKSDCPYYWIWQQAIAIIHWSYYRLMPSTLPKWHYRSSLVVVIKILKLNYKFLQTLEKHRILTVIVMISSQISRIFYCYKPFLFSGIWLKTKFIFSFLNFLII